ncbi:dTDP-4-dehydrorhamnose reductase, partial [Patescibacteria group bacterium]|nr:dTDP-4-dehydrorhamnose reductase [Patescibacteria group bacterium]
MKKLALIGANGQLSTDIRKVFDKDFYSITPLTHQDIEVTDITNVKKVLEGINPDIVINTSAYHKVDEVEDNPDKAFLVNASAQKNIAELCQSKGWTTVFISTDYVFGLDEKRNTPFSEADNTGPVNVYGTSKLAGENFTRYIADRHFVIRVCGLHGTAGSSGKGGNFVELMIRLGKEKGQVSVVDDQTCTPTYTKNIAENLNELLKTDNYGLYHMTSQGQCSWYEFASEIFKQMKMKVECNPVDSSHFPTRAKRPKYSVLENKNLKKMR